MKIINKWTNIFILLISVTLCFLAAELFIRSNPNFYSEGYKPSKNDQLVYELEPNYLIKSTGSRISSQGLHDYYYSKQKPADTYRIAVVGDSTSFGLHVGHEHSLPKYFERILNEKLKGKYQVINFSVPGYNISQEYEIIKTEVLKFNPNMIITVFDNNDIHMCNYLKSEVTLLNFLYIKSFAIHDLIRRIELILYSPRTFNLASDSPVWNYFKKNILKMFYYNQRIYKRPGLEASIFINGDPPAHKAKVPKRYWHMLGLENYEIHLSKINSLLISKNIKYISSGFFENSPNELKINYKVGIENICNFDQYLKRDGLSFEDVEHELGHLSAKGHYVSAKYLFENFIKILQYQ